MTGSGVQPQRHNRFDLNHKTRRRATKRLWRSYNLRLLTNRVKRNNYLFHRVSTMTKWVYRFGNGHADGDAKRRDLLGGKGGNLAEMANLGLPVPPGFTLTTELCTYFYAHHRTYPDDLKDEVNAALEHIGAI